MFLKEWRFLITENLNASIEKQHITDGSLLEPEPPGVVTSGLVGITASGQIKGKAFWIGG